MFMASDYVWGSGFDVFLYPLAIASDRSRQGFRGLGFRGLGIVGLRVGETSRE